MIRLHCFILKKIFGICHLNDLKSFTLKPEVDTSLERRNVNKRADQAVLCLVEHGYIK